MSQVVLGFLCEADYKPVAKAIRHRVTTIKRLRDKRRREREEESDSAPQPPELPNQEPAAAIGAAERSSQVREGPVAMETRQGATLSRQSQTNISCFQLQPAAPTPNATQVPPPGMVTSQTSPVDSGISSVSSTMEAGTDQDEKTTRVTPYSSGTSQHLFCGHAPFL